MARRERLCCCEYTNLDGQRSHILACCCNCELIDESCERLITCKAMPPALCRKLLTIIHDRLRIPWCDGKGARQIDPEVGLAVLLMPTLMLIAAQGWEYMILTFALLPIILYTLYRRWIRNQVRSRFFLTWSVISLIFLMSVFEFEVVPYLEILFHENFALGCLVITTCVCAFLVRMDPGKASEKLGKFNNCDEKSKDTLLTVDESDKAARCQICNIVQTSRTSHCHWCGTCISRRDHHSLWLDTCIGSNNHRIFIIGMFSLIASCIYGGGLAFTTICHPVKVFNLFLVPDRCTEVFGDFHIGLCFASAVYTAMICVGAILTLLQQLWLISRNVTLQEHKRGRAGVYSRGLVLNWKDFWLGCNQER